MITESTRRVATAVTAGVRSGARFAAYLARRFEHDQCLGAAAALAFTSLLALVPLFTVVFVTLSAFPAFGEWREGIEDFMFENFVPAFGDQVQDYMGEFADKARGLRAAGLAVLLVTALALMASIESTFNVIWGIRRKRPLLVRFLVYWAVLTLAPLLIGAGMVATSYVISLPVLDGGTAGATVRAYVVGIFPVIATTIAFVLFFQLIPYRPVPFRHALAGGIVASVLFELAKSGFAVYVSSFPAQEAIYGAFATVPIFLLWIYLSWLIVLLGAEITQCLTTFRTVATYRTQREQVYDPMYCTYRVLLHLYRAHARGEALSDKALMQLETRFGYAAINRALERLDGAGWISRNDDYLWVLMRDLNRMTLLDLLRLVPSFASPEEVRNMLADAIDRDLERHLAAFAQWSTEHLAVPLTALFEGPAPDAAAERRA